MHAQERGLKRVEPVAPTDQLGADSWALSIVREQAGLLRNVGARGDDRPPSPAARKILGGIKAERGCIPKRAGTLAAEARPMRLCCVLDDHEFVVRGNLEYCLHLTGLPIEMHWDYRPRAWRDGLHEESGVEAEIILPRVYQYRRRARRRDGHGCRDERVSRQ